MKIDLGDTINYNYQCNHALIAAMQQQYERVPGNAIKIFSHILNVHRIWNCKIDNRRPEFTPWQIQRIDDFDFINQKNHSHTLAVAKENNGNREIQYMNTNGTMYVNYLNEILFHVINHSTYHRGQVAAAFRKAGLKLLLTDYIFYKMKKNQLVYGDTI
ncbi:damage-inducible protein DinB [Panacibacter ginsenosidivorans]|uniref:Damage-inducible protein DinB n=1 Tax=Panacibacter ginsenosidivorans TaxID=1813871 RepID=A0A5B8VAA6_9BACT|nr:DinB family protein [Panacibacter ginsenosidivorans]QEC67883.1 damage-inducible protein DinB [Panacibacter ginsenosidivorans]